MMASHVLIVDDDPALLQALPEALQLRMGGLTVDTAGTAAGALARIAARDYDAIVTDIKMPGMDGFALLAEIRARRPDTPTLIITGHGERALAIEALRGGACDFVQKPIDRDYFVASLRRAIQMNERSRRVKQRQLALETRVDELERAVEESHRVVQSPLRWLLASSEQLERIVQQITAVVDSALTVLVEGETGTGKELVARAVHQLSARCARPFIAMDCGVISDTLIEPGQLERVEGGTLFLDEIANLSLATQANLVPWLGRSATIAASSVSLDREVQAGRFRQDLCDGLRACVITLPPLRERDDILHLANDFVAEASVEFGRPCREISEAAAQVLLRHSWPGNVRELRNVIRRATLLAAGVIEPQHLSLLNGSPAPAPRSGPTTLGPSLKEIAEAAAAEAERQTIRQALQACKGNKTEAARRLRIDYKTLHLKVKQHGFDAVRFRKLHTS